MLWKFVIIVESENLSSRKDKRWKYPMPIKSWITQVTRDEVVESFKKILMNICEVHRVLSGRQSCSSIPVELVEGQPRDSRWKSWHQAVRPSLKESLLRGTANQQPSSSGDGENFLQTTEDSARCAATREATGLTRNKISSSFENSPK